MEVPRFRPIFSGELPSTGFIARGEVVESIELPITPIRFIITYYDIYVLTDKLQLYTLTTMSHDQMEDEYPDIAEAVSEPEEEPMIDVMIRSHHRLPLMVSQSQPQFFNRCEVNIDDTLATYNQTVQRFLMYHDSTLTAKQWSAYVDDRYIPIMKQYMTSTTPFAIYNDRLRIFMRGLRWSFINKKLESVSLIIPNRPRGFDDSSYILRANNDHYAIFQRSTSVLYAYAPTHTRSIIVSPRFDVIDLVYYSETLWVIVTEIATGMLYCSRYTHFFEHHPIGHLHLRSDIPSLIVAILKQRFVYTIGNRLSMTYIDHYTHDWASLVD